jgi:hypothetical protein
MGNWAAPSPLVIVRAMSTRTRLNLYATLAAALGFVFLAFSRV